MDRGYRVHKNNDRRPEILSAASLINKFNEGCPMSEVYKRGIDCYETLLDLIEEPVVGEEVSKLIKQPQERIGLIAIKIINLLLFNKENDPFLSLGLSDNATTNEIKKRWKRLLMIYHPDRMSNRKGYEEVAKKINQAHEEIEELQRGKLHNEKVIKHNEKVVEKPERYVTSSYFYSKYLKLLPTFIIIAVISIAIFTIILLFIKI